MKKVISLYSTTTLVLLLLNLESCVRLTPCEQYVMQAVDNAVGDTICLQFVGCNYVQEFPKINQKFLYHNDSSTIIVSQIGSSFVSIGFTLIDKEEGEQGAHFEEVLPADTIKLLRNGQVSGYWSRGDTSNSDHSIYDKSKWNFRKTKSLNFLVYERTYTIDTESFNVSQQNYKCTKSKK